jgi:hypothetical protein
MHSQKKRRQLTKAELQAAGAAADLMARRYSQDGRARLEQLTAEDSGRPSLFAAGVWARQRVRAFCHRALLAPSAHSLLLCYAFASSPTL